ncbi:MAG: DUF998 domain-containing protein [Clostridia bacterium]|nr:DUF998 domain-containing protein [Clostridia bacterium]
MKMKPLMNWLGLLGVISMLSYTAAVVFSPLAYPGYDWTSRAVSDLSAANAPSLGLWTQLSALYGLCGITCVTLVCVAIQGKLTRGLRTGIYLFAVMQWISGVGYTMFPLSDAGYTEAASGASEAMTAMFANFQDAMHIVITALVIGLSIISLLFIAASGYRKKRYVSLAVWATVALMMMMAGGIGTGAAPKEIMGIFERFSVFAATGFNAVLGVYLWNGFKREHA